MYEKPKYFKLSKYIDNERLFPANITIKEISDQTGSNIAAPTQDKLWF